MENKLLLSIVKSIKLYLGDSFHKIIQKNEIESEKQLN